jgi:D-sedoheptulose 7-phosphate isomerase
MEIPEYFAASAAAAADLVHRPGVAAVQDAAAVIAAALRGGGKVLFCGNGGSAADAQHLAAELVGELGLGLHRDGYQALALTTDTSVLTAIGNDFGYDQLFERQVVALGRPGDVLVALSTSGRSRNVVRAAATARERGLTVVAMLGEDDSTALDHSADVALHVPGRVTGIVQQGHITVGHALCARVERLLAGTAGDAASPSAAGA